MTTEKKEAKPISINEDFIEFAEWIHFLLYKEILHPGNMHYHIGKNQWIYGKEIITTSELYDKFLSERKEETNGK